MASVGEEFPKEQERLLQLLDAYREIGPAGVFGYAVIRESLVRSFGAMASGNVTEILASFQDMKERE